MLRVSSSLICGFVVVWWMAALPGCRAEAPVTSGVVGTEVTSPLPTWSEGKSGVSLTAKAHEWTLTPREGASGVDVVISELCTGHLTQTRVAEAPEPARAAALEARLRARLVELAVSDVVVRDRGEVAHGTFRAFMMRVDGVREGAPWSARLVGSFVTRSSARFYVEIMGSSRASGFVARRTCFDALGAAVTIRAERR